MNYAWSNPSTGIREQTEHSTPERMLAEAKLRVWQELQELFEKERCTTMNYPIYRQEPIGQVTVDGFTFKDGAEIAGGDFAWTNPDTGQRRVSESLDETSLVEQLKRLQQNRDSPSSVIIYATRPECTVNSTDPEPPPVPAFGPEDENPPRTDHAGDSPDIDAMKQELAEVAVMDDGTRLAKITAWALLDIAMTIRETAGDIRYPEEKEEPSHVVGTVIAIGLLAIGLAIGIAITHALRGGL